MHPNSLKNLRPWKPGESGWKNRKPLPEELRGINSLTQLEVTKLISKYARMTVNELIKAKQDAKTSVLDQAICSIFMESIDKGDFMRVSFLLDRCIGKVPNVIEEDEDDSERERLEKMPMRELLQLIKSNLPDVEEGK